MQEWAHVRDEIDHVEHWAIHVDSELVPQLVGQAIHDLRLVVHDTIWEHEVVILKDTAQHIRSTRLLL